MVLAGRISLVEVELIELVVDGTLEVLVPVSCSPTHVHDQTKRRCLRVDFGKVGIDDGLLRDFGEAPGAVRGEVPLGLDGSKVDLSDDLDDEPIGINASVIRDARFSRMGNPSCEPGELVL